VPQERFGEIKSFVEGGLNDFSISRLVSKMPWGIPVPGDEKHVMYVWFDALVNYISAVGWPHNMEQFNEVWNGSGGVVQYCGKDNLRQQAAMWQAMLMAAQITPSQKIIINGFIMSGGQKMSKSLGNVISPYDLVRDFGVDAVRYFVAQELHPFEDSDVTQERLLQSYNAGLANGLGNLVSRVMKMAETHGVSCGSEGAVLKNGTYEAKNTEIQNCFARYNIMQATSVIWQIIQEADKFIQLEQPFKKIKVDAEAAKKDIAALVFDVQALGKFLKPVMPETSQKILDCVASGKTPTTPLFVRK
jgi:methionyl-tRNA synthetase